MDLLTEFKDHVLANQIDKKISSKKIEKATCIWWKYQISGMNFTFVTMMTPE